MANRNHNRDWQMRHRIAQEAARILCEEGVRDYYAAKRKAANRLGAPGTRNLPKNSEVEQALAAYQRLFKGPDQARRLRELRGAALEAMRFFRRFRPRLVGSVLAGTAGEHSDVNLHLFTDTPEEVAWYLMERNVPFENTERRLRVRGETPAPYPGYRFLAGDAVIDLTVFPLDELRQAPRSPIDGRPMRRADIAALKALLEASGDES